MSDQLSPGARTTRGYVINPLVKRVLVRAPRAYEGMFQVYHKSLVTCSWQSPRLSCAFAVVWVDRDFVVTDYKKFICYSRCNTMV